MSKRYYPLFVDLENERCVVVGEGGVADEKAAALRRCGAEVDQVAGPDYRTSLLDGARVVIDCSGDDQLGRRVYADAEARGILVNVLDRTHWCRFIAPAVVDRHPLQIAISTAGESPFLASALRRRLEALLPAEWSEFVSLVGRIRRDLRRRGVPIAQQTAVYRRLLASPVRALLAAGDADAAERAAREEASRHGSAPAGRVTLVGAGPGDQGLLTLAAVEALADADLVLHDALVPPGVLRIAPATAEVISVGKRAGGPSTRQEDINRALLEAALAGRRVVRLKGGDPFVFGRGGEELEFLIAAGIDVAVVPGVSSAVAAPAAAGIPLTLRGVATSVAFVTASTEGRGPTPRLAALAGSVDTLVVLMGLASLAETAQELVPVLGWGRPAAVVAQATLPGQRVVRAPLGAIAEAVRAAALEAPATLVIGEVAAVRAVAPSEQAAACLPA